MHARRAGARASPSIVVMALPSTVLTGATQDADSLAVDQHRARAALAFAAAVFRAGQVQFGPQDRQERLRRGTSTR